MAGMLVISAESALTYRMKPKSAKEIGRELGARYVVEGSVERAGDRVRVNAQLIDTASDAHLWAERFDREFRDLFELQSEITGRIAFALSLEMVDAEAARPIANPEALDYIFRGREAFFGRVPTREKLRRGDRVVRTRAGARLQSAAAKT